MGILGLALKARGKFPAEVVTWHESLIGRSIALYALARGRAESDLNYYAEHGSRPEREQSPAEAKILRT
jgi:hypothetical protein